MGKKLISILGPQTKLKLSPTYHIKLVSKIAMKMLWSWNTFLKTLARKSLMSKVGREECIARGGGESGDTTELNSKRGD